MELVNSRISSFNYSSVDMKNRPNLLFFSDGAIKIKQKAAKMTCLFKLLPFIIGDKIEIDNKYWDMYIKLSEIIDSLYLEHIDETICNDLKSKISDHHTFFKRLFPMITLKKKHHNMVHYPSAMLKIGPLANFCTLRFEGKHVFFKTVERISHNHKNVPLMLARKHQIYFAYNLIASNLLNKVLTVLDGAEIRVSDLNGSIRIKLIELCKLTDTDKVIEADILEYYGQVYKKDYIVSVNAQNKSKVVCSIISMVVSKVF
jgi:hypothetical protein